MRDSTRQNRPEPRSQRLDTRFGEAEVRRVEKVAKWHRMPPSTFVREAAMAAVREAEGRPEAGTTAAPPAVQMVTSEQLAELHAMRVDWKRVGTNLNQLVRSSHRGDVDLGRLADVVEELAGQVDEIRSLLGGSSRP